MSVASERRFSWGSDARVAPPRWESVVPLELVGAILIVGLVASFVLGAAPFVLAKVRMMEALSVVHIGQIASAEHYAMTGRALATDMFGQERFAENSATPEYEKHLSTAAAFAAVASASGQSSARGSGSWHGPEDTSPYYARSGVIDGAVVALGRVRAFDRPYRMSFSPAVAEGGGPVLLWTCGRGTLPPGYRLIGTRAPDDIPSELLIYPCRASRPW